MKPQPARPRQDGAAGNLHAYAIPGLFEEIGGTGYNLPMTARSKRAIVRRLVLIAGTVLGIMFALWPRPVLYRVGVTDFAQRQRDEDAWTGRRTIALADYIKDRTEGRLLKMEGQAWQDLHKEAAALGEQGYFLPDRRPLDKVAGHLDGSFTYVAFEQEGTTAYLDVTLVRPGDFPKAPAHCSTRCARLPWACSWLVCWAIS